MSCLCRGSGDGRVCPRVPERGLTVSLPSQRQCCVTQGTSPHGATWAPGMVMVAPRVAPAKVMEGQGASRDRADLMNQAGSGWGWWWQKDLTRRAGDIGDTHSKRGEITALLYHVVTPAGREDGGSPRPHTAPRPGAVRALRVCTAGTPPRPPAPPRGGQRAGAGQGGHSRGWGCRGAARRAPPASCRPQPSATPSPGMAALV